MQRRVQLNRQGKLQAQREAAPAYAHAALSQVAAELGIHDRADKRLFQVSKPADAVPPGNVAAEQLYEPAYDPVLGAMIDWVITHEGPVLDQVLARRIARAHGFQRTGSRTQERVEQLAHRRYAGTEESGGTYYWPAGTAAGAEFAFRWPSDDEGMRGVEEICEQ